jgi:uncharacterized protein YgiM (DUF1202 family)
MKKTIALLLLWLCLAPAVFAQSDCPAIVRAALDSADQACGSLARNQVCYGNIKLAATQREGATALTFDKTGDKASLLQIKTLQLSSFSLTDESWGVALMKLQANLPDTLPGQNVTMLLFGDVQIDNDAVPLAKVSLSVVDTTNVRLRPTTNAKILTSFNKDDRLIANGRLSNSQWLRVLLDDRRYSVGWISTDLVKTADDVQKLTIVQPGDPVFGPMQAFTFRSGVGDRPCDTAPDSGILVQTPKGQGKVTLQANGVQIALGSTVYLQAQPSSAMTVTVIDGGVTLQSAGGSQAVPAGTYSTVSLDSAGQAASAPAFPKPYDAQVLQTLPLDVGLPDQIGIGPPLDTKDVARAAQAVVEEQQTEPTASTGSGVRDTSGRADCDAVALSEVSLHSQPNTSSPVIFTLHQGAAITVTGFTNIGWIRGGPINGVVGNPLTWMRASEVQLVGACRTPEILNP